ncbi:hypothetical protein AVEN_41736-1 [Araneus ventricosus]|uniref:Uncharacterized protein n=1 Tax=Araneus ventricosus TaxID=182803 RepID=A0A4Y2ADA2_ARAVE|nr:hypothetical protein AVEN_41736-1 [Araneus ventricosus]
MCHVTSAIIRGSREEPKKQKNTEKRIRFGGNVTFTLATIYGRGIKTDFLSKWQICCITFDDDVTELPYGENPTMDSEDDDQISKLREKEMMKNVKDCIYKSDFEKYDFYDDKSSDEYTYYPPTTTYIDTSGAKVRKK